MKNDYCRLARLAVENFIKHQKIISPPKDINPELLKTRSGVFVSINKDKKLRGCIGTYLPTQENIAQEIIHNAIAAATRDNRFSPIQEKELNQLSYTVYLLEKPSPVKDLDELDPKKYGILVQTVPLAKSKDVFFNGHFREKSALLLPNLEGIDTKEKQIVIACHKGNINPFIDKIVIYKFKAKKFTENEN